MGLFSALPVDSSWSCGKKWGLRPAREQGLTPAPAPAPAATPSPPLHLSAGVPLANILVFVIQGVPAALPGDKGVLRRSGLPRFLPPAPSTSSVPHPSPSRPPPAHPLPSRGLTMEQSLCLHLNRAEAATCKRRGRRQGFPTPTPHWVALTHSTLPSAAPGTGTLA